VKLLTMLTLVLGLSCRVCLADPVVTNGVPDGARSVKPEDRRVSLAFQEPMAVVDLLDFLALKAGRNLMLQVTEMPAGKGSRAESGTEKDLNLTVTNMDDTVVVMLAVTNVPVLDVIGCIVHKAGWAWELRNKDIIIDVSHGGTHLISISPNRAGEDRAAEMIRAYASGTHTLPNEVAHLGASITAMEKYAQKMRVQFDEVNALLRDNMRLYEPVVVDWLEATEEAPTNTVPTAASNSVVAPAPKPER